MRSLERLTAQDVAAIDTFAFDLDDTVLDHGRLREEAYAALFRLRQAGLTLVASTGRPAGWAEIVARQWPIAAALAENGAVAWITEEERVVFVDSVAAEERRARRAHLAGVVEHLLGRFPDLHLADDNGARITDTTFDIGEHRKVDGAIVDAARREAERLGVRTFVSSVHMHVTLEGWDKASGFARWATARGQDPRRALKRAAFAGDSANDAAAFAAFGLTFAVANVAPYLQRLTVPPRFIATARMGLGFAQIAEALVRARRSGQLGGARDVEQR